MKRILIVGSGIAGLAAGELFARNGHRVVIAEKSAELGGASSLAIQNWFHAGNLYLYRPSNYTSRLLADASKIIRSVYPSARAGDVCNIDRDGRPTESSHPKRWFESGSSIYYCYAKRGNGIPRLLNVLPAHRLWFKHVVTPRLHVFGQPFSFQDIPHDLGTGLCDRRAGLHDDFYVFKSSDGTLYSKNILDALVSSCVAGGASFVTSAEVCAPARSARGKAAVVAINGREERFDTVILAAGDDTSRLLESFGARSRHLRSLHSPILVLNKRISPHSFVITSPNRSAIFIHILYRTTPADCEGASTIGGNINAPAPTIALERRFKEACMRRFDLQEQDVAGVYWGCKTEQIGSMYGRSYVSVLNKANENLYWMLPGKFSLFPYLASLVASEFGLDFPTVDFAALPPHRLRIRTSMVEHLVFAAGADRTARHRQDKILLSHR